MKKNKKKNALRQMASRLMKKFSQDPEQMADTLKYIIDHMSSEELQALADRGITTDTDDVRLMKVVCADLFSDSRFEDEIKINRKIASVSRLWRLKDLKLLNEAKRLISMTIDWWRKYAVKYKSVERKD